MMPVRFTTLLLFSLNTQLAIATCIATALDPVDLLVEDCYLSMKGYEVVRGRTLPRLQRDDVRTATHDDWHTAPIESLKWREGSNVRCEELLLGSVVRVEKRPKCCDVVMHDALTGKTSRPCDKEPFIISKPEIK